MKKLLPLLMIVCMFVLMGSAKGCGKDKYFEEYEASPTTADEEANQEDALIYCASQGGEIEMEPRKDMKMDKFCVIKDKNVRCGLMDFYNKKCGH